MRTKARAKLASRTQRPRNDELGRAATTYDTTGSNSGEMLAAWEEVDRYLNHDTETTPDQCHTENDRNLWKEAVFPFHPCFTAWGGSPQFAATAPISTAMRGGRNALLGGRILHHRSRRRCSWLRRNRRSRRWHRADPLLHLPRPVSRGPHRWPHGAPQPSADLIS